VTSTWSFHDSLSLRCTSRYFADGTPGCKVYNLFTGFVFFVHVMASHLDGYMNSIYQSCFHLWRLSRSACSILVSIVSATNFTIQLIQEAVVSKHPHCRSPIRPRSPWEKTVIIADLLRPEVARPGNFVSNLFAFFWKNDPIRYNFQNSVSKVLTPLPIDVVLFKFCDTLPTGNRQNRVLFIAPKFQQLIILSLLSGSRPKSAMASPSNVLTVF